MSKIVSPRSETDGKLRAAKGTGEHCLCSPSLIARNSSRACYRVVNPRPCCFNQFPFKRDYQLNGTNEPQRITETDSVSNAGLHATSVPDLSPRLRPLRNSLRNYLDGKSGRFRASFADNHRESFLRGFTRQVRTKRDAGAR